MCLGRPRLLRKIVEELPDAGQLNKPERPYKAMSISRMLKS